MMTHRCWTSEGEDDNDDVAVGVTRMEHQEENV